MKERHYPAAPRDVYLFATCLVDLFVPEAGLDAEDGRETSANFAPSALPRREVTAAPPRVLGQRQQRDGSRRQCQRRPWIPKLDTRIFDDLVDRLGNATQMARVYLTVCELDVGDTQPRQHATKLPGDACHFRNHRAAPA